jgi:uncharacterized membrane protein
MVVGVVLMVCGLITLVVLSIARLFRRQYHSSSVGQNPIDIVQERYAKGEITKEQFDRIRKDIS